MKYNEEVTFYFPNFSKKYSKDNLNLDDYNFFSSWEDLTIRAWIIQTYLQLKKLNLNVNISDKWPQSGTVVLLSNNPSLYELKKNISKINKDIIIITIRADEIQWRPLLSDIEIVQNGVFANEKDTYFIPHWPQPGIIKRDNSRGHLIENIVFNGGKGSLCEEFYSDKWLSELSDRKINFEINTEHTKTNWGDYSTADLLLAVRPSFKDKLNRSDKPASKLINSWFAEVPALLGSEIAYLELKESEFDFLEVNCIQDGLNAIDYLRSSETTYFQMVQNGIKRSKNFTSDKISQRWKYLLFDKIPTYRDELNFKRSRIFEGNTRKFYYFFSKKQTVFEYKRKIANTYRNLLK